jgi:hypothetical protein
MHKIHLHTILLLALPVLATTLWIMDGWDLSVVVIYVVAGVSISTRLVFRLIWRRNPSEPMDQRVMTAYVHTSSNQQEIMRSDTAGCLSCLSIFDPRQERMSYLKWIGSNEDGHWAENPRNGSAYCPACDEDTVIGSASDYPITEEFMLALSAWWLPQESGFWFGIAVVATVVSIVALILGVVFLALPLGRILVVIIGVGTIGVGIETAIKRRFTFDKTESYQGGPALLLGVLGIVGGVSLIVYALS